MTSPKSNNPCGTRREMFNSLISEWSDHPRKFNAVPQTWGVDVRVDTDHIPESIYRIRTDIKYTLLSINGVNLTLIFTEERYSHTSAPSWTKWWLLGSKTLNSDGWQTESHKELAGGRFDDWNTDMADFSLMHKIAVAAANVAEMVYVLGETIEPASIGKCTMHGNATLNYALLSFSFQNGHYGSEVLCRWTNLQESEHKKVLEIIRHVSEETVRLFIEQQAD